MLYLTKNIGQSFSVGNLASVRVLHINSQNSVSLELTTTKNTIIQIAPGVCVHFLKATSNHQARFGVEAPKDINILF